MSHVWADINLSIVAETDIAVGFGEEDEVTLWLPKSQIDELTYEDEDDEEIRVGDFVEAACIPRWLAEEKNLSY